MAAAPAPAVRDVRDQERQAMETGVSHPDELDEQGSPVLTTPATPTSRAPAATRSAPASSLMSAAGSAGPAVPSAHTVPGFGAAAMPNHYAMAGASVLSAGPQQPFVQPSAAVRAQLPTIEQQALDTQLVASLFNRQGQLLMPPALKGSREILVHQNTEADREGLERVRDDGDLERMRAHRQLVALPASDALSVDERLPWNRRYCRPWTAVFLADLARAHFARFHTALVVTSAVRTVEVQQRLLRTNGNAAPVEGQTASPHLTGQAIDLGKKPLSQMEIAWMRGYLLPLVQAGKVDVEEEFQQACFHISVYRSYGAGGAADPAGPGVFHRPASALATALH